MFGVGDEVVCVNDSEPPQAPPNVVVKGQTYTVTGIERRPKIMGLIAPGVAVARVETYVYLAEVPTPKGIGFFAWRFRKAEKKSRETDISVLKEIADGTRVVPLEPTAPVREKEKV